MLTKLLEPRGSSLFEC
uniref:Uncharacterized protein n=1 Tax=Arundo donax TaxID=35708 RepID=A0A0A8Y5W2_ARUDO